jgi:hypothetical protein
MLNVFPFPKAAVATVIQPQKTQRTQSGFSRQIFFAFFAFFAVNLAA